MTLVRSCDTGEVMVTLVRGGCVCVSYIDPEFKL